MPKYVNPKVDQENGKSGKFGVPSSYPSGIATDLSKFILYPERDPNVCMIDIIAGMDSCGLATNYKTLSAYKAILYVAGPIWIPDILLWLLIATASGSIAKEKISEDRGSP